MFILLARLLVNIRLNNGLNIQKKENNDGGWIGKSFSDSVVRGWEWLRGVGKRKEKRGVLANKNWQYHFNAL